MPLLRQTATDLKALDGTDGEDCLCEVRVQLLKYRLAETYRKTGDHALDDTADGVAFRDLLVKIILRCLCCLRIRKTKAVILDLSEIHPLRGDFHRSDDFAYAVTEIFNCFKNFSAMAPAATRPMVSRAEERPPPR